MAQYHTRQLNVSYCIIDEGTQHIRHSTVSHVNSLNKLDASQYDDG